MDAPVTAAQDEYLGHVYTADKAGLPPLERYLREPWRHRAFVSELGPGRAQGAELPDRLRPLLLVLNPLLNAAVGRTEPDLAKAMAWGHMADYLDGPGPLKPRSVIVGAEELHLAFTATPLPKEHCRKAAA